LLIGIAIIGKFAHPPSLLTTDTAPIPRLASLHRLSYSPGPQPPGKPLVIFPTHRWALTAAVLGHTGESYIWLGKFRGFI